LSEILIFNDLQKYGPTYANIPGPTATIHYVLNLIKSSTITPFIINLSVLPTCYFICYITTYVIIVSFNFIIDTKYVDIICYQFYQLRLYNVPGTSAKLAKIQSHLSCNYSIVIVLPVQPVMSLTYSRIS